MPYRTVYDGTTATEHQPNRTKSRADETSRLLHITRLAETAEGKKTQLRTPALSTPRRLHPLGIRPDVNHRRAPPACHSRTLSSQNSLAPAQRMPPTKRRASHRGRGALGKPPAR